MNSIGQRLRDERSRLGLNQGEMAAIGGVQRTAQSNYERDDRMPDAGYLSLVAAAGVDVLYVITGEAHSSTGDDLQTYGDAWEALDRALQSHNRNMPPEKKRLAAEALFQAIKAGDGEADRLADLVIKAA